DRPHMRVAIPLHWTRALVEFTSMLKPLLGEIRNMFRGGPLAVHRMRDGRKAKCQPLSTNSERSKETQGMRQAVKDFDCQTGIDSDAPGNLLSWIRGDGGSYANLLNLFNYSAPLGTFKNKIATPEIWHTGATDLNSTASNHYGPATSSDPSSLSKCSNIAGFKRPSNVKSCDYYPTVRNLDGTCVRLLAVCLSIFPSTDDLDAYFRNLAETNELPDLSTLLGYTMVLVDRYATQSAIRASLSESESTAADRSNKVPVGNDTKATRTSQDTGRRPKVHQEKDGFTGDRVLRNSQIFMQDFGWWIEFAHAVPEGDIGCVWEIMKIWIFKYAGSAHQNYMAYLLEVYCMLRYEASNDLRNAILNNWLLNIMGEEGGFQ
ncbi:hypothetical protein B0H13DRAFT_1454109, partial [Mycena leptocephala]